MFSHCQRCQFDPSLGTPVSSHCDVCFLRAMARRIAIEQVAKMTMDERFGPAPRLALVSGERCVAVSPMFCGFGGKLKGHRAVWESPRNNMLMLTCGWTKSNSHPFGIPSRRRTWIHPFGRLGSIYKGHLAFRDPSKIVFFPFGVPLTPAQNMVQAHVWLCAK